MKPPQGPKDPVLPTLNSKYYFMPKLFIKMLFFLQKIAKNGLSRWKYVLSKYILFENNFWCRHFLIKLIFEPLYIIKIGLMFVCLHPSIQNILKFPFHLVTFRQLLFILLKNRLVHTYIRTDLKLSEYDIFPRS